MKIGVSSYSYSRLVNRGILKQIDVIKTAKEAGFEGMEDPLVGVRIGQANLRRLVELA